MPQPAFRQNQKSRLFGELPQHYFTGGNLKYTAYIMRTHGGDIEVSDLLSAMKGRLHKNMSHLAGDGFW
jgi:hypothetical protein